MNPTSSLRVVVYGQGSTENRLPTLIRISDRLREELAEVAQGQLYVLVEVALRKYIDELKARPPGNIEAIDASSMPSPPAMSSAFRRESRPRAAEPAKRKPRAKKADTSAPDAG